MLQADVDLVSIMARTGFLPEQPASPGASGLVSQGSQEAAMVTSPSQSAGQPSAANGNGQPARTASSGNGSSMGRERQRPLAEALPRDAWAATQASL